MAGVKVRAWSKAIIDAGPPVARANISTISSHRGAGPGHATTTIQTTAWNTTVGSTSQRERRRGCRLLRAPITGPLRMPKNTNSVMIADAVAGSSPSPAVRKGNPHSSMNAVPAKGVAKCDQKPSRVPGCAHDSRNPWRRSGADRTTRIAPVCVLTEVSTGSSRRSGGRLRMMRNVRIAKSTPSPATLPKATLQLVACRRAASGTTATIWPSWPMMPVNCTSSGAR